MTADAEVARSFYESINRWLDSYWADPALAPESAPGFEEVMDRLTADAEWDWLFSSDTFTGRPELEHAVADWLETVSDWRIEVQDVIEGNGGRVLAILRVVARGKGSGTPVLQRVFSAITVRDGKVARIEDHTERAEGFAAVGLEA